MNSESKIFFLKTVPLGVKSCGESIAHIPEAKKRFYERLRRDAKIENHILKAELAENLSPGVFAYGEHDGDVSFWHNVLPDSGTIYQDLQQNAKVRRSMPNSSKVGPRSLGGFRIRGTL